MRQRAADYFIVLGIGAALVLFGAWSSLQNPWGIFSLLAGMVLLLSDRMQEERRLDRAEESLRRLREEDERRKDREEDHAERAEERDRVYERLEKDRQERQEQREDESGQEGPATLPGPGQKLRPWKQDDQA